MRSTTDRVLGISFFTGPVVEAVERHVQNGGYLVIPAAPPLIKLNYDEEYRRAMQSAEVYVGFGPIWVTSPAPEVTCNAAAKLKSV